MNLKFRLSLMNFLQFAVWGAYLTCMGNYLGSAGLGPEISWFYAIQGIVSIFMPTIIGIIADRKVQPQRMLGYRQVGLHRSIHSECGFLYANLGIVKHHCLPNTYRQRYGHGEGLPPHPRTWHRRLHCNNVVC